jgi:hypothetical protein
LHGDRRKPPRALEGAGSGIGGTKHRAKVGARFRSEKRRPRSGQGRIIAGAAPPARRRELADFQAFLCAFVPRYPAQSNFGR